MAKRFFYVCAGLLCLALTYHLGAQSAKAQSPGNAVVGITMYSGLCFAVTENGDAYYNESISGNLDWHIRKNV